MSLSLSVSYCLFCYDGTLLFIGKPAVHSIWNDRLAYFNIDGFRQQRGIQSFLLWTVGSIPKIHIPFNFANEVPIWIVIYNFATFLKNWISTVMLLLFCFVVFNHFCFELLKISQKYIFLLILQIKFQFELSFTILPHLKKNITFLRCGKREEFRAKFIYICSGFRNIPFIGVQYNLCLPVYNIYIPAQ